MALPLFNKLQKTTPYVVIAAITAIYLGFLSRNQVGDAYWYAYLSLSGEQLFEPHHLLYCLLGNGIVRLFSFTGIEPILLLQATNALFAGGCLLILLHILKRISDDEKFLSAALFFCGACFGFIRFATDNECYILPLFFSLFAIKWTQEMLSNSSQRHIIKISLSIVFACLFHQIAILLWINLLLLFLRLRMRKEALIFLGISMLIPLTYFLIYGMTSHEWTLFGTIRFALRDYLSGTAQIPEIQQVTLLTAVSIMRTFMQVHGYMYAMFLAAPIFTIAIGIVSIGLIGFGIVSLFLKNRVKEPINRNKAFITFLWFQVALTLLFSAFSNGNAEFMTMLPFLLIILYTHYFSKNSPILTFATALFVWNFYFAVYPYHCKSLSANSEIADLVAEFPEAIFVVSDKPTVENIYLYRNVGGKLPGIISSHCYTKDDFTENKLEGKMVITDVADSERAMSRARVTQIGGFDFSELKRVRVLGEYEGLGDNLMGW